MNIRHHTLGKGKDWRFCIMRRLYKYDKNDRELGFGVGSGFEMIRRQRHLFSKK